MLDLFSVSVVMIRSLAVLIIVNAVYAVPAALFLLTRESHPDRSSSALALVAYILPPVLLLIFAKELGRLLTRGLENTSVQVDESNLGVLQAVAFSLLGAYVLVDSIPALVKMITIAVHPAAADEDGSLLRNVATRQIPLENAVQELTKTGLGVWLLFGTKRIVASIRSMGKKPVSGDSSE